MGIACSLFFSPLCLFFFFAFNIYLFHYNEGLLLYAYRNGFVLNDETGNKEVTNRVSRPKFSRILLLISRKTHFRRRRFRENLNNSQKKCRKLVRIVLYLETVTGVLKKLHSLRVLDFDGI